jgi:hypothetical protein
MSPGLLVYQLFNPSCELADILGKDLVCRAYQYNTKTVSEG